MPAVPAIGMNVVGVNDVAEEPDVEEQDDDEQMDDEGEVFSIDDSDETEEDE